MNKTPCYRREGDPNPAWSLDPSLDTDTNPDPRPGRIQTYSARSRIPTWMNGAVSVIAELLVDVLINLWPLFLCILIIQKATKTCLWVYTVPKVIYRIGARRLGLYCRIMCIYVFVQLHLAWLPCDDYMRTISADWMERFISQTTSCVDWGVKHGSFTCVHTCGAGV